MHAVQASAFGSPAVLRVVHLPDPAPGPGEVAIDVTHSAVGLIDLLVRQGRFADAPGMPQPPFVPGLEVAGTIRSLGEGVTGFAVGEHVVALSTAGTGGYASVKAAAATHVVSIEDTGIAPALAVSMIPNATMVHVALTAVAHLVAGENVLVHGALGGFASAVPGVAKRLGAARVVGTVRAGKLAAAQATRLPYDRIVDSERLGEELGEERFDVVVDAVGGGVRTASLAHMRPGGRLVVAGNASDDWAHAIPSNDLWLGSLAVAGFNAGAYLPAHPQLLAPALRAAVETVGAGLGEIVVDALPFSEAVTAHERMESRALDGRLVLTPGVRA